MNRHRVDAALDLRLFLDRIAGEGELRRIDAPVAAQLEAGRIIERCVRHKGPVLAFTAVGKSRIPLYAGLFASPERAAAMLGCGPDGLISCGERLRDLLCGGVLPDLVRIPAAPLWDEVDADLDELPLLRVWPKDAGREINLALIISRDPESGVINRGLYRLQVERDGTLLAGWHPASGAAAHLQRWETLGEAMPVAIVFGPPPALLWAASASLPAGLDEVKLVSALLGAPVAETICPLTGLPIPAAAEAVYAGFVRPGERGNFGPFANYTGTYPPPHPAPRIRPLRFRRRIDMLFSCTVTGPPPLEAYFLFALTAKLFLPLLQRDVPELVDLVLPPAAGYRGGVLAIHRGNDPDRIVTALRHSFLFAHERLIIPVAAGKRLDNPDELLRRELQRRNLPFLPPLSAGAQPLCPDPDLDDKLRSRAGLYNLPEQWFG